MDDEMKDFWRDEPEETKEKETDTPDGALFTNDEEEPSYDEAEGLFDDEALLGADDGLAGEEPLYEDEPLFDEEEPDGIEPFVPTDAYRGKIRCGKKRHTHKRRAIWAILILIGVALLCVGGAYAYKLTQNPAAFFEAKTSPVPETTMVAAIENTPGPAFTPTPTPSPTPDPYTVIYEQADLSMMQNIVNVLIVGVDYAEERETWNGKHDYHADVMMVMAINFDQKRVDLISLPRDTYANIPGVQGIYKLNAALNCGGGYDAAGGAGFLKCCETARWMLGDIPVDYYYAVTMPAVKQLVDAVGGVDYDLELSFSMVGRHYNKGQQHLDGQGVLDYLRVRKNVQGSGDLNRINRQKQMLIALFKTMQEQNLILKIPDIVKSFNGQLYTNCSLEQTAALALFAYDLSSENIGMYSMGGTMKNIFNWNFCLTDQSNRVDIVKTVYGVEVPKYLEYTSTYAQYRWADMVATRYLKTTRDFTSVLGNMSADSFGSSVGGGTITGEDGPVTVNPDGTFEGGTTGEGGGVSEGGGESGILDPNMGAMARPAPLTVTRLSFTRATLGENGDLEDAEGDITIVDGGDTLTGGVNLYQMYFDYFEVRSALEKAVDSAEEQAQRYRGGKSNSLSDSVAALNSYTSQLKSYAVELAAACGYSTGNFSWTYRFDRDSDFNEVYVDFR